MSDHSTTAHAHHPTTKTYAAVLAALVVLTVITVLAAGIQWGSPSINVVVALAIATVKASLVALFFMHLRYDKPMNALILFAGVLFLGVFLGLCLIDTDSRDTVRPANLKVETPGLPPAGGAAGSPAATAPAAAPAVAVPHH